MTLRAVFFDMDGLLVDTEPVWTIAERELAAQLGGTWSDELKERVVGTRLDVAVPTILRWYDVVPTAGQVSAASAFLLARMVELYAHSLTARPGAVALLAAVNRAHVPVGLVSSSYRVLVNAVLAGGFGPFTTTLAGDEVTRGKPDPEPYLVAAWRLGVDPDRCVVLEDSPAGVASGEQAGCAVVAVPSVPGVQFPSAPRRLVTDSLEGVDVTDLEQLAST